MHDLAEGEKLRRAVADLSSRAETALSVWSAQVRDRTKPRADATANTEAGRIVAEENLRLQLAELENEMAVVQRDYDGQAATVAFWEQRSMIAMQHSDAVSAQEALQTHSRYAAGLQELGSELTILRALVKSCRDVLATTP